MPEDPRIEAPQALCEINAEIFRQLLHNRMRLHVRPMAMLDNGERSPIPGYLGKLVLSFLYAKHVSQAGTTYYRFSLAIMLRILMQGITEYDGVDTSSWIQYPFQFDDSI